MIKFNKSCYIIAEIGINHEGKFKIAKKLILNAKKAGASAVKFQYFNPETLADKDSKKTKSQSKNTNSKESLFQMWERMKFSFNQFKKLKEISKKNKLDFICSVFDQESLKQCIKLDIDAIKVASGDITDHYLLKEIAKSKKPILLSTGMADKNEIRKALRIFRKNNVYLLHCVSLYPVPFKKENLLRINSLQGLNKKIGYSDHSPNINTSLLAISMGIKVLEKHFTLDKTSKGADHSISADYQDLKTICNYAKELPFLMGNGRIKPSKEELYMKKFFRKSIYYKKNLKKKSEIKVENIYTRRPKKGICASEIKKIIGKKIKINSIKDLPLLKKHF